jgi:hypothetical protein
LFSQAENPVIPSQETSQKLTQMIMGFRISQMIYVVARLGIADLLKSGAQTADVLAQATGTHAPSLYRTLRSLASVAVFAEDAEGRFALTPLAELLQTGVAGSKHSMALFYGSSPEWPLWGELLYSVQRHHRRCCVSAPLWNGSLELQGAKPGAECQIQ